MANAYGFVEITGVAAATSALDIMCKTADVRFVTWERKLGGRLVTIIIEGEVAAVKEAIAAAEVNGIKKPAAVGVLARPHPEIVRLVSESAEKVKLRKAGDNVSEETHNRVPKKGGNENDTGSIRNDRNQRADSSD
ncbi:MAG: BMC domain-containing protein [Defluviitaleaceae bacterium]|nr:BMC domain-containing protein [Defluviitaleaceae bacterium]